jgi:hypothetical protein
MAGWYIRRGEKIVGPVELPKLHELVATGRLFPTDQLAKDIAGPWKDAARTTLFAAPQPVPEPAVESSPSSLVPKPDKVPAVVEVQEPSGSTTAAKTIIHVGQVVFAGIGRGMLASWGAISRSMATRSQRKHEIKLAKIQANALTNSRRQIAPHQRHVETPAKQAPTVFAPQLQQTTVVQVVNKNKQSVYGCSGCGSILLLITLCILALIGFGSSRPSATPPSSTPPNDATKVSDNIGLAPPQPSAELGSSQSASPSRIITSPIGAAKTVDENPLARRRPSAEVVRARLVPYTTPAGLRTKIVLVDWKNTGETVIRAVDADIAAYDRRGNKLGSVNYTIYAVSNNSPGVSPGETYRESVGEGFAWDPAITSNATRVDVSITEVVEHDAY